MEYGSRAVREKGTRVTYLLPVVRGRQAMIRIIIVDDEILSRIGQSFLDGKEDIVVSGIFGEAEEPCIFWKRMVDVVLTDIEMAEMDGLEFIREISQRHLAKGVIIVSCHDDFPMLKSHFSWNGQLYPEAERDGESIDTGSENVYEKLSGKPEKEGRKLPEKKEK